MYNREICSYFYRKYMVQIENEPVSQDLYFLFHTLASTYQQNGRKELAVSILKKLCQISRERNSLDVHQELVFFVQIDSSFQKFIKEMHALPGVTYIILHSD